MITIVDYGVGNLTSIFNMLKKAGVKSTISCKEEDIKTASKLILPGMGHFDNCMIKLNESGLRNIIEEKVNIQKTPVLGICVGLQILMKKSEEGNQQGLNWIKGDIIRFQIEKMLRSEKIPNMGWLKIEPRKSSKLLEGLDDARFYFAHSYHANLKDTDDELMSANYGYSFTAAVERENVIGVQFHPEKSHRFGLQLLKNFAENY